MGTRGAHTFHSALAVALLATLTVSPVHRAAAAPAKTYVYFDQREEEDVYTYPSGELAQGRKALVPPWDPNGQLCLFPDSSGRFVTGYNPKGAPVAIGR